MAKIVREELWKHPGHPGMIIVTTNAIVKANGALVMGRGAARQARDRIPEIDLECGTAARQAAHRYGFHVVRPPTGGKVGFGIFQVKYHYKELANLELIELAVKKLTNYANEFPDVAIRMNYPGIGHGGLTRQEVEPLLLSLPDNITICWR